MANATELKLKMPWGHIAAKAWGSPTDFPVLCVHGILDNAGVFDRLIDLLPNNFYYLSIDLPGHGFSTHFAPGVPLDFYNYILALRYLLEELNWRSFYYIGHSLGAQLGVFYNIIYPKKIKKMILIEGLFPFIIPTAKIVQRIKKLYDTATMETSNVKKNILYSYDEVMHTLTFNRKACLNTKAAKAIFNRSVTEDGGKFKFNRDHRLKVGLIPILDMQQMHYLFSNLKVKILFFLTKSSFESIDTGYLNMLTYFLENMNNFKVVVVEGNHDVHNNYPQRISSYITTFFTDADKVIISKL